MACFKCFICFKFHVKEKSVLTCYREESISNQTNRAMERATTLPKTPPGWLFLSLSPSCTTRGLLRAFHSARSRLWTSWYEEEHLSRLVNQMLYSSGNPLQGTARFFGKGEVTCKQLSWRCSWEGAVAAAGGEQQSHAFSGSRGSSPFAVLCLQETVISRLGQAEGPTSPGTKEFFLLSFSKS